MRRLRYSVAMSLDGYIAGPNGEFDWIIMDPEIDFGALFRQFDLLLMGRKTFEALHAQGASNPFSKMQIVVCSRTLRPEQFPNVTVITDNVSATVNSLKSKEGKDIWLFGGGELFRSLLDLDLVDTVEVGVVPILLGGGIPLLPVGKQRHRLKLTSSKALSTGILMLTYDVQRSN
jgi:dihydrofolate reductase